jgi:hypothetical protein
MNKPTAFSLYGRVIATAYTLIAGGIAFFLSALDGFGESSESLTKDIPSLLVVILTLVFGITLFYLALKNRRREYVLLIIAGLLVIPLQKMTGGVNFVEPVFMMASLLVITASLRQNT